MMGHPITDVCVVGARLLADEALVRLVVGPRAAEQIVSAATHALSLSGSARMAALRDLPCGPRILAAVELGRRATHVPLPGRRRIQGPSEAAACLTGHGDDERESLFVLALDARLRLARLAEIPGTESMVSTSPADILGVALAAGCSRLVLAHRHLGAATPSQADLDGTATLVRAADVLGVIVFDHVILGDDGHQSMLHLGFLPPRDARYA